MPVFTPFPFSDLQANFFTLYTCGEIRPKSLIGKIPWLSTCSLWYANSCALMSTARSSSRERYFLSSCLKSLENPSPLVIFPKLFIFSTSHAIFWSSVKNGLIINNFHISCHFPWNISMRIFAYLRGGFIA